MFTLRSQQPSSPWPPSSSPKVPKLGGAVIFTSRVGKGAKAEAGAIQWHQLRLKYDDKAPPCQLCLRTTQQEISSLWARPEGWPVSVCLEESQSHEPRLVKKSSVICRLQCLRWRRELCARGCQLLFVGPGGQGGEGERGNSGHRQSQPVGPDPRQIHRSCILALGRVIGLVRTEGRRA